MKKKDRTQESENIVSLDLPVRDGSGGYSNLFLRYYNLAAAIISDGQGNIEYRLNLLITLMTASIPDVKFREKMHDLKNALIEEKSTVTHTKQTAFQQLSQEDQTKIQLETNMELLGEVTNFFDLYLGNSRRIGVSIEALYPEATENLIDKEVKESD